MIIKNLCEWWYNNFRQKRWPKVLSVRFSFYGKASSDRLYVMDGTLTFDKPLEFKYVDYDGWGGDVFSVLREEYKDYLITQSKKELVAARKEKYLVTAEGSRITGDYIVACEAYLSVDEWQKISYDEWKMLKAMERE